LVLDVLLSIETNLVLLLLEEELSMGVMLLLLYLLPVDLIEGKTCMAKRKARARHRGIV
jgi:hypothetical protein